MEKREVAYRAITLALGPCYYKRRLNVNGGALITWTQRGLPKNTYYLE